MDMETKPDAGCLMPDAGTPETDAFMTLIDDSEIDLRMVESKLGDFETQRDEANKTLRLAVATADELGRQLGVAKAERDEARKELAVYRKCDGILDALPGATDDPVYIHLKRLISERDQLRAENTELKQLHTTLRVLDDRAREELIGLRARIAELEKQNREDLARLDEAVKLGAAQGQAIDDLAHELTGNEGEDDPITVIREHVAELEKDKERLEASGIGHPASGIEKDDEAEKEKDSRE